MRRLLLLAVIAAPAAAVAAQQGSTSAPALPCMTERLQHAAAALRDVANIAIPAAQPLPDAAIDRVHRALTEAQAAVQVSREVQQRFRTDPYDPLIVRYVQSWCVQPAAPAPSEDLLRELLDASVALSVRHPGVANDVGAVMAAIYRDASAVFDWNPESNARARHPQRALFEDWLLLVSIDRANFASTGVFLEAVHTLQELVSESNGIAVDNASTVAARLVEVRQLIDRAGERLNDPAEAWKYYTRYADTLFGVADFIASIEDMDLGEVRHLMMWEGSGAAWEGFRISQDAAPSDELTGARQRLMDRAALYGLELAEALDYSRMLEFEARLVDDSGRIMPEEFQCHVHAHMAQAHYVLGTRSPDGYRYSADHLSRSCGLVSYSDLERLQQFVQHRVK